LVCALALWTSRWWLNSDRESSGRAARTPQPHLWVTVLIFAQLLVAATMRHQHAGLAIPDFPLAYARSGPTQRGGHCRL